MRVTVDEQMNTVVVRLRERSGQEEFDTHALSKHGLTLRWDGHGALMAVEFASTPGEPIILYRGDVSLDHDYRYAGGGE